MKTFYVYILECSDNTFYVGVTNNVGRRFIEHITGLHENSYTFKRRPLKLVFCKQFNCPMKAIKYEKQLKGWTRAKKEALIVNDLDLLHELAKCKNETSHETYNESGFDFAHPDSLTTVTSTGKDGPGKIFLLDL